MKNQGLAGIIYGCPFSALIYASSVVVVISIAPVGHAFQLNSPSTTPVFSAATGPIEDQSGMKKQLVACLMPTQSFALAGPSNVETNDWLLYRK